MTKPPEKSGSPEAQQPPPSSAAEQVGEQPADETMNIPSLEELLRQAQAERDAFHENSLRIQADAENMRKRLQKDFEQERQYALLPLVRELLSPLDNLDRALQAADQKPDLEQLVQGVRMVAQQFDALLAKNHVVRIPAVGQPFDPNLHQAMQQIPSADHPPLTVLQEYERGYTLYDRVVRPSSVVVSAAPPEQAQS